MLTGYASYNLGQNYESYKGWLLWCNYGDEQNPHWCNWQGVGFRFKDSPNTFKYPNVGETNNNGLGFTVELLEGIYTDPKFPRVS